MKKIFLIFILTISVTAHGQTNVSCEYIRNGIFYYYPKNSPDHYLIYRTEDFQKEISVTKGDTTVWKIEWQGKCKYSLKFVSSNLKRPEDVLKILKKHTLVYVVSKMSDDYYTFKGSVDDESNPQIIADTIWLKEKINIPDNEIFKQITNENETRRLKDTSKYAILYLYRPGKITNSLGNYLIYFDNVLMCVGKNNTGYVFKVLKEGTFQVASKLYKDESSVNIDIKFGKTYYIKSVIHWGISSRLYNFKLEMATVTAEEGQSDFEKIKNK